MPSLPRVQYLLAAYRRSSIVILPSTSEAEQSSIVLVEAMASGRPVIGTNIGGTPYIITHETSGLLVEPRDPHALARAITRILTDYDFAKKLSHGALQSAQSVDWKFQIAKYQELFRSLLPHE